MVAATAKRMHMIVKHSESRTCEDVGHVEKPKRDTLYSEPRM